MLNIDQVRLLENKVERAVNLIKSLSSDNDSLKKEIGAKDKRIAELENLILVFKDDQTKIEQGIVNALAQLSAFEDSISVKKIAETQTQVIPTRIDSRHEQKAETIKQEKPVQPTENSIQAPVKQNLEQPSHRKPEQKETESAQTQREDATHRIPVSSPEKEPSNPLQKDLDDVLGHSSETAKQMDIF